MENWKISVQAEALHRQRHNAIWCFEVTRHSMFSDITSEKCLNRTKLN